MSEPSAPPQPLLDYVRAAAALNRLPLDAARVQRVAAVLARTQELATLLEGWPAGPGDEPAELYRPAPFPDIDATDQATGEAT